MGSTCCLSLPACTRFGCGGSAVVHVDRDLAVVALLEAAVGDLHDPRLLVGEVDLIAVPRPDHRRPAAVARLVAAH